VTSLRAATGLAAARWLLDADVVWSDLARYGPPGFEAYVRVAFDQAGEADRVRSALAALERVTTTPSVGYAAIWEGWGGRGPTPDAPRIVIPNRTFVLFTGPVAVLRDAAALAWHGDAGDAGDAGPEPHLVWPADQAWCLACEVDEEIEFTVGCSDAAASGLAAALPGSVRRVEYGANVRTYRDLP
jgi:hypothetical protein